MIIQSQSPDVEIPNISWPDYFFQAIESYHDIPALIDGANGKVITYDELKNIIRSVAGSLQRRGYTKGDVFAIYAKNSPEFVIVFQAVLLLGGIITTVNSLYTTDELVKQLKHSKAKLLFTSSELLEKAAPAVEASNIRELFVFRGGDSANSFDQLLQGNGADGFIAPVINPEKDLAVLPYSSGTTGLPKGVMICHRNLVAHNIQFLSMVKATPPSRNDRILVILPFFHIYGMTVTMNAGLTSGTTLVIMSEFEPEQFLRLIQEYKITRIYLVPPIILFLANHPMVKEYDISSLNYIMSGAAPLGAELIMSASERIGHPVYQGYGLTETSPVTHSIPDLAANIKHGSIGVLMPNTKAMIVDPETGGPAALNQPGELLLSGPQVMLGYLDNPEATAATIDENGWLHTGDIAYVDEDGYFFIVDRLKELIKYKGYQVAPAELEALLLSHPAVADVAVVPSPNSEAGEVPKAFIVLKEEISAADIMAWVAERVAPHKKVREVEFIEKIPKSPSGKILRRVLRNSA